MTNIIPFKKTTGADYFKITSASKIKRYSILPAWVLQDPVLRRTCFELEQQGWKIHLLVIGNIRQVLFSHMDVVPVPARFLRADEAKKAQEQIDIARRERARS